MEKFSETKRGGRPRVISDEVRSVIDFASKSGATERTKQNKLYQLRAMRALGISPDTADNPPEAYLWLWPRPHVPRPGDHRVKWTVLAELGRIRDEKTLRAAARRVCELRLSTREAVLAVRCFRNGGAKAGDSLELANVIIDAINDYTKRRPGLTPTDIRRALYTAEGNVIE